MKFIKIIWILTAFCFSTAFADTGDWDISVDLETGYKGTTTSFVHTEGLFIACHEQSTAPVSADGFPDGDLRVKIYEFDGTVLKSTEVNVYDRIGCVRLVGNSSRVWVVWTEPYGVYRRIYVKRITFSGGSWGNWTALTPYTDSYPCSKGQMMLNVHADEDGLWIVYNNGDDHGNGKFARLYYSNTGSSYTSVGTGIEVASKNFYNNDVVSQENYSGSNDIVQTIFVDNDYNLRSWRGINGSWEYTTLDTYPYPSWRLPIVTMIGMDEAYTYAVYLIGSVPQEWSHSLRYRYQPFGYSYWSSERTILDNAGVSDLSNPGNYTDYSMASDGDKVYVLFNNWSTSEVELIWINRHQHGHEEITGFVYPYDVCQLSINGNDIYVPYTKSVKDGSTWMTGNIAFTVKDGTPITPTIVKGWSGNNPKITWTKPCFDVEEYNVYVQINGAGAWNVTGTTSNLYYVDINWRDWYGMGDVTVRYKVKAVDYDNNLSEYSNTITYTKMIPSKKVGEFGESRPTEYALYNAYPNPFNPTTTIEFDLPKDGFVNMSIYNSLGEMVGNLVNGQMVAGRHQVQFDGSSLSSGIYFIRMNSNQFVKTQKIILTK